MKPSRSRERVERVCQKLKEYKLGMKRKSVSLEEWTALWHEAFLFIKENLLNTLSNKDLVLEHFGSTSISGMVAKPVLDIMLIFSKQEDLLEAIPLLKGLDFIHKGDMVAKLYDDEADQTRQFFSFYDFDEKIDYIHLHVFVEGHSDIKTNLGFRDKMRKNPKLLKEYKALKLRVREEKLERPEYRVEKAKFMSKL